MFLILLLMILAIVLGVAAVSNSHSYVLYIPAVLLVFLFVLAFALHFYKKSSLYSTGLRTKTLSSFRLRMSVGIATLLLSPIVFLIVVTLAVFATSAPPTLFLAAIFAAIFLLLVLYHLLGVIFVPYRFDTRRRCLALPRNYSGGFLEQVSLFTRKLEIPFSDIELLVIGSRNDIMVYGRSTESPAYVALCREISSLESEERNSYSQSSYSSLALPVLSWAVSATNHLLCIKTASNSFIRSIDSVRETDLIRLGNSAEKEGILVVDHIRSRLLA